MIISSISRWTVRVMLSLYCCCSNTVCLRSALDTSLVSPQLELVLAQGAKLQCVYECGVLPGVS